MESNKQPKWCDIEDRDRDTARWLNENGFTGSFAEIGVLHGGFSRIVLSEWKGSKYYMVDPWETQSKDVYKERNDGVNYESCYNQCLNLAKEDSRVTMIRKLSVDGAKEIPDKSLDVVFIDGNHAYSNVLEDLDAWIPKLRSGGLLAGDDYYNDTKWPNFCEVKRAVDRWMAEHYLTFTVCRRPAFWCIVP